MKLLLLLLLVVVSACQPTAQKQTSCARGETFQESTRRCIASVTALATPSPIQQVPVVSPTSVAYNVTPSEDTIFTARLTYSDANFDYGLACNINSTSGLNISTACSCDTLGTCTVSFVGNANANGAASFTYTIIDNDGTSLPGTVNLVLAGVDDAPVVPTASVATWNEDVINLITFGYADVEGDLASACSVTSLSINLTFPLGCNCVAGICTAFAQGTSNFNGVAVFQYQLYAGTSWSNVGTYTNTLNAVNDAPIGSNFSTSVNEDGTVSVSFTKNTNYTDPENDNAINFNIYNQTNVTVNPTSGACVAGVCTVTVTPTANLNSSNTGTFSFDYTLTDASLTSIAKTVTVSVTAVDDAPVGLASISSLTPAVPSEDSAVTVTLSYTDVDADLATGCTISSVGNGAAGACTCSGAVYPNSCSFTFTPNANVNGANIASFAYTITSGLSTSASVPLAFNLTAVNDTPTMTTIADVTDNESSTIVVNGITVDEGGGVDENAQVVSISLATDNPTLLSTGQIAVNFSDLGDASGTPMSLTLSPTTGQSGVANVTVTATDNGTPVAAVSKTFKVTINNSAFSHGGWKNLKALGTKTNASGTVLENPSVTLEWEAFTAQGSATIAGYKVYRATSIGGQDFNTPLACNSAVNSCTDATTVSSSAVSFIDSLPSNIASGTTYYYVIRPVDGTTGLPTVTTESYSEIDVPIPPMNMALVHRWIANKETCTKMGQTPDPLNHNRCLYTGPGNTSGYYDIGAYYVTKSKTGHLFVDRFEAGCNYTAAPTCTTSGCIGNGDPATIGCNGSNCNTAATQSIFYDRTSGTCYRKTAATTWTAFNTAFVTALGTTVAPNKAHLPPLLKVNSSDAQAYCLAQGKRLMTRKEQVAASAWSPDLTAVEITTLETGLSMSSNTSCNTMSASGLTYSNGQLPTTGNEDTLPATLASTLRTVRTGSTSTATCASRFGVQDLVGNVREWTLDEFTNCSAGSTTALAKATLTQYGIVFTAKRFGTAGNFIEINFESDSSYVGNETVTVTKTDELVINIRVSDTATSYSVYNLIQSSADAIALVDIAIGTAINFDGSQDLDANLAGGSDGATFVGGYSNQSEIDESLTQGLDYIANTWGVNGNDLTITYEDSGVVNATTDVRVENGKDIIVTLENGSSTSAADIDAAIAAHDYANALVTANVVTGTVTVTAMSTVTLTGGGKSYCASSTKTLANYFGAGNNFVNNDLSAYSYYMNGGSGTGNGPGGGYVNISSWLLGNTDANSFGVSYIHLATGMPAMSSINDSLLIGGGVLPAADLFADQFDVNADPETYVNTTTQYGNSRALASGGAWYGAYDRSTLAVGATGNKAGRYAADLLPQTLSDNYTGFRCVQEAP